MRGSMHQISGYHRQEIADGLNIPAFIVDPVVVDEMAPIAKFPARRPLKGAVFFTRSTKKLSRGKRPGSLESGMKI